MRKEEVKWRRAKRKQHLCICGCKNVIHGVQREMFEC